MDSKYALRMRLTNRRLECCDKPCPQCHISTNYTDGSDKVSVNVSDHLAVSLGVQHERAIASDNVVL